MRAHRGRTWLSSAVAVCLLAGAAGCAKRKEQRAEELRFLTAEKLYEMGLNELSRRNLGKAREYLERIQVGAEASKALEPLIRLALADITFYKGDDLSLIEARSKYLDFVAIYGDHPMAPYAQFQAGICSLKRVNHPSRDQSQTRVAILDLRETHRRYPTSRFARAASEMIQVAESYLAEHDFLVGRFYLRRKVPLAATKRFQKVLDAYPYFKDQEKIYFFLGRALLQGEKDVEAVAYLNRLLTDYPDSEFAEQARRFLADFSAGEPDAGER